MRSKFKKMLAYFLLSAIILPGWILGSSLLQKPESAKAADKIILTADDSEGAPNFTHSADWISNSEGYLNSSHITDGDQPGDWARWKFTVDEDGKYLVLVSWLASSDRSSNAKYSLLDGALNSVDDMENDSIFSIDQTEDAFGNSVASETWSDYKGMSIFDLTAGDYYVNLSGSSSGKVSADSVEIIYDSLNPSDQSIVINSGATYTNNKDVVLTLSVSDNLGVAAMQVDECPITNSTPLEEYQTSKNLTLSSGDGTKEVCAQYFDLVANVSTPVAKDQIILDTSVSVPTNITANLSGNIISVKWDAVLSDLSGIAGYNIYSSSDGYVGKINSSLITTTTYDDVVVTNGTYSYKVEAVDNTGNISDKSSKTTSLVVDNVMPAAPNNVNTSISDHTLTINWDAVGGGVTGYIVTINGVSRDAGNVTSYSTNLNYGTYTVLVTSYFSDNNFGINDTIGLNNAKNAAIAAGLQKSITLTSVTKTSTVSETSVAPETAEAAETAETTPSVTSTEEDSSNEGLQTEEEGQIKGEEENTETTEEKINWTPWIILFVLIVLAGAATGGYFYWFAGEEEVETKVKTKSDAEKKEISKSKAKNTSSKKPRRW